MKPEASRRAEAAGTGKGAALSRRGDVSAFLAMDVMREANRRDAAGEDVVHLEVGQPGAPAPARVIEAARAALAGPIGYTEALGIAPLRERIARHYAEAYGIAVDPRRIVVTTGSSGGFLLSFLALFDAGARVGLPLPAYPAYRNIFDALDVEVVPIETGPATRWALTEDLLAETHRTTPLDGVLVASPANPSGTLTGSGALEGIATACARDGLWFVSDEIYHGLTYEEPATTALAFSDEAVIINSFSKYYCMTGWRIGWMVVPDHLVRTVERLAQNLFISAPTLSQFAALAAFDARDELEAIKAGYARNRALLTDALPRIGLDSFLPVDGAFYMHVDVGRFTNDSLAFAEKVLAEAKVAVTPGIDFDAERGQRYIRLSFAGREEEMARAVERLDVFLRRF